MKRWRWLILMLLLAIFTCCSVLAVHVAGFLVMGDHFPSLEERFENRCGVPLVIQYSDDGQIDNESWTVLPPNEQTSSQTQQAAKPEVTSDPEIIALRGREGHPANVQTVAVAIAGEPAVTVSNGLTRTHTFPGGPIQWVTITTEYAILDKRLCPLPATESNG